MSIIYYFWLIRYLVTTCMHIYLYILIKNIMHNIFLFIYINAWEYAYYNIFRPLHPDGSKEALLIFDATMLQTLVSNARP